MVRTRFIVVALVISAIVLLYSYGCDELVTETIEITVAGHPQAEFQLAAGSNDSGCVPFEVEFRDQSVGPINKWTWYFGDGDSAVNDTNPSHVYDSAGVYNCTLRVQDTTTDGVDIDGLDEEDPEEDDPKSVDDLQEEEDYDEDEDLERQRNTA